MNAPVILKTNSELSKDEALSILSGKISLLDLLQSAYNVREKFFGKKVYVHILENIKNGHCSEDCSYCAQRKSANSGIMEYGLKEFDEILKAAHEAKKNGAYRFCMVTSGRGPTGAYFDKLLELVSTVYQDTGLRLCLSAGILGYEEALQLKEAGLNRYNHNLNTSESYYSEICTSHTYMERVGTLQNANRAGLEVCSGIIAGMGESDRDLVDAAYALRSLGAKSIPVNFFIPIQGHSVRDPSSLTPEKCLRILCLMRLVNPEAEIRAGAGRERHLRSLQALALYPANSLFAEGYLNVSGDDSSSTFAMIQDAGFQPEIDRDGHMDLDKSES